MKLRLPGWASWILLMWLGCLVVPDRRGKVRLNLFVAVISWTYGLVALDLGLSFWARFSRGVYWDPFQLGLACLSGLSLGVAGLLFGAFTGIWAYSAEQDVPPAEAARTYESYPPDPRRETEQVRATRRQVGGTAYHPIWWRILLLLLMSALAGLACLRGLVQKASMPVLALASREVKVSSAPDWVRCPLADGYEVSMPGRPARDGEWMIYQDSLCAFAVTNLKLQRDESMWRWNFWGEMLGSVQGISDLNSCRQAGLEGLEFRLKSEGTITRMLLGPKRLYVVSVRSSVEDIRIEQFMASLQHTTSLSSKR